MVVQTPPDALDDALKALGAIAVLTVVAALAGSARFRAAAKALLPTRAEIRSALCERRRGFAIAGAAVALCLVTRTINLFSARSSALVFDIGINHCSVATAMVAAVQLAASVAGRGRAMPGMRLAPGLRIAISLVVLIVALVQLHAYLGAASLRLSRSGEMWRIGAAGAVGLTYLALCEAGSWVGGPSVVLCVDIAAYLYVIARAATLEYFPSQAALELACIAATIIALRRLALSRERLQLIGITPWAPGDLAFVPSVPLAALGLTLYYTYYLAGRLPPWPDWLGPLLNLGLPLLGTIATIVALVYLDRRLREAERHAAARAAPAPDPQAAP